MENNGIGLRIKELRHKAGLTQTDLAKLIGVSKQNLYKYENGIITNIPSDKIEALAHVLNTTPAYLMGWEDIANTIRSLKAIRQANKTSNDYDYIVDGDPSLLIEVVKTSKGDRKGNAAELAMKLYENYRKASPEIQEAVNLLLKVDKQ